MEATPLTLDRLLKLRLVVGRFGEMDAAKWWNTLGLLGPRGAVVLKRGLPRTHYSLRRASSLRLPSAGATRSSAPQAA